MKESESDLKRRVLRMIRSEFPYVWCYKTNDRFTSGIPDIVGSFCGKFFAIELKSKNGKVTPLQEHTLERIRAAEGRTLVAREVNDIRVFFSNVLMVIT